MGCCGSKIPANKPIENGSLARAEVSQVKVLGVDFPQTKYRGIQHTRLEITSLEIINLNITNTDLNITGLEITSTNLNITNLELTPIKLPSAPSLRRRLGSNANGD
ncbi:hypothetical protein FALBO_7434 [Fusarium albosuccineum]|uniref:Uncharacterized protein n=1 Tax=Fusarium albosuccineum TaxID=1237068 RepID=A0A8H4PAU6_9HYPO|nr:hypothetical protein FALBO_7434 [Fusarium albosuccineum]